MSYTCIGTALVLEDKEDDSDTVHISPLDLVHDIVSSDLAKFNADHGGSTAQGGVKAQWIPSEDTRDTAPDMCAGEKVMLYSLGDEDLFYWMSIGKDKTFRKLEHVEYSLSNTQEMEEEQDGTKEIKITLSTRDQIISIETPDNRKEKAKYKILYDLKEGIVTWTDNHENTVTLDSTGRVLDLTTSVVNFNVDTFHVTGECIFDDILYVNKACTFNATLDVADSVTFNNTLRVSGRSTFNGISVSGSATMPSTKFSGPIKVPSCSGC